jgi:DNA-binding NarL/FixJ family response regulator
VSTPAPQPRVLLLLEETELKRTLARELSARGAVAIVGEAMPGTTFEADVVAIDVVDGRTPEVVAADCASALPGCPAVLLVEDPDEDVVVRAVLAGAAGLLSRELAPSALAAALLGAAAGEAAVPRSVQWALVARLRTGERPH